MRYVKNIFKVLNIRKQRKVILDMNKSKWMQLFQLIAWKEFPVCVTEKRNPVKVLCYWLEEIMKDQCTLNLQHTQRGEAGIYEGLKIFFGFPQRNQIRTFIKRIYFFRKELSMDRDKDVRHSHVSVRIDYSHHS